MLAFLCMLAYFGAVGQGFNWDSGHNEGLLHLEQLVHLPLTQYVPSVYRLHQASLFLIWLTLWLCLTFAIVLLGRQGTRLKVRFPW